MARRRGRALDFPEEFGHISLTTLADLQRTASALRLKRGDTLAGLGCGMGGPALWLARETGANLIGVDLSAVAVEKATARAARLGLGAQAEFRVGSFAATGLDDQSVDGATSEDALQYALDKNEAMCEVARILRPGARFAFTAFELELARAATLPVLSADGGRGLPPVSRRRRLRSRGVRRDRRLARAVAPGVLKRHRGQGRADEGDG